MEIDTKTLPPSTRDRLEHHQRLVEKQARCTEFARLAKSDVKAAGAYLLAMNGYEQLDAIRELEGDEVPAFCRASNPRVRERVLEIHPNPRWLESQLVADKDVPRWVRMRHAEYRDDGDSGYHREQLVRGYYMHTSPRDITAAEAHRLREAGAGQYVAEPKSQTMGYENGERSAPEPHKYKGLTIEGDETWRREALVAAREIDHELDDMIKSGKLVVEELPLAQCRARMGSQP